MKVATEISISSIIDKLIEVRVESLTSYGSGQTTWARFSIRDADADENIVSPFDMSFGMGPGVYASLCAGVGGAGSAMAFESILYDAD